MSFRLRKRESIAEGFRRIMLVELDAARGELILGADDPLALHEVRKRIKRMRAVLRLGTECFGPSAIDDVEFLRVVAQMLARHRAADALQTLLQQEARAAGAGDASTLQGTVRLHQTADTGTGDRAADLRRAQRVLATVRRRLATCPLEEMSRGACRRAYRKSYRRARGAFLAAKERATEENLHRLRKLTKILLNQGRLIRIWGGPDFVAFRRRLLEIDDALGRGRDCAFLGSILRGVPAAELPLRYGVGLRARLENIAREENARSLLQGSKTFRRKPRDFVKALLW